MKKLKPSSNVDAADATRGQMFVINTKFETRHYVITKVDVGQSRINIEAICLETGKDTEHEFYFSSPIETVKVI